MTKVNIDRVAENLMTIQPLLYINLLKPVKTKTILPLGAVFIISELKKHQVLSMSEIGRRLSLPKPHVTGLVDKLIIEGFVERVSDPTDRRIINIRMTVKGAKNLMNIKKVISEDLRNRLSKLDEKKLEVLAVASQQVKEILISIFSDEIQSSNKSLNAE
jgi:DNA-binding MarR family transcriptional regulator